MDSIPFSDFIELERRVVVQVPLKQVFAFGADLRNDAAWRDKINETRLDADQPALGVVATEDARLSARLPHFRTSLRYAAYEPNRYVRCTSLPGSPSGLDVERRFRALSPTATEFSYTLRFETAGVRQALGFVPPRWFLRWYSGWMMTRYLGQLTKLLEQAQPAGVAG